MTEPAARSPHPAVPRRRAASCLGLALALPVLLLALTACWNAPRHLVAPPDLTEAEVIGTWRSTQDDGTIAFADGGGCEIDGVPAAIIRSEAIIEDPDEPPVTAACTWEVDGSRVVIEYPAEAPTRTAWLLRDAPLFGTELELYFVIGDADAGRDYTMLRD